MIQNELLNSFGMIWSHSQAEDGQLEVHLFDERERVAQTKRSANQMQSSMDNIKSFLGEQPNDGEVYGKFANLTNDMKIWSIQFSGGNADSFRKERSSDYRRVAPGFTELQLLTEITMNKGKSDCPCADGLHVSCVRSCVALCYQLETLEKMRGWMENS
jgi:hypothetical protein